jgi:hypothetical protein
MDKKMNKKKLTHFVDLAFIIQFVLVGYSSFIMYFNHEAVSPFLISVHNLAKDFLLVLITAHIVLNWRWILFTIRKFYRKRKGIKEGEVIEANYMPIE